MSMRRCLCSPGIFAIIAILLLLLLQWLCCPLQAGVVALDTMVSLPLSMHRHLCRCHDGIVALIVLAPLPRLHERCCPHCTCVIVLIALTSLPSHLMGVVTVIAPMLLPQLTWCFCAIALVSLPLSRCRCCPWCSDIIALVTQVSLLLLCLHCAVDLQASLPSLSWHILSRG